MLFRSRCERGEKGDRVAREMKQDLVIFMNQLYRLSEYMRTTREEVENGEAQLNAANATIARLQAQHGADSLDMEIATGQIRNLRRAAAHNHNRMEELMSHLVAKVQEHEVYKANHKAAAGKLDRADTASMAMSIQLEDAKDDISLAAPSHDDDGKKLSIIALNSNLLTYV